jgi:biopolymer transport protein ExbB
VLAAAISGTRKKPLSAPDLAVSPTGWGMVIHRLLWIAGCGPERVKPGVSRDPWKGLLQTPAQAKVPACENLLEENVFSIIQAAGWPIWPLLLASIIAVALIIERLVALRRSKVVRPACCSGSSPSIARMASRAMVGDLEAHSPLGRVLGAGLRNVGSSREIMKEAIEEAGSVVSHDLERYLTTLGTIASISPLMGLFGTVVGMIEIFLADPQRQQPRSSSHTAFRWPCTTPAFGLLIAIPSMIFWRHFRALVDSFVIEMQQQAVRLVEVLHGERKSDDEGRVMNFRRGRGSDVPEINLIPSSTCCW